MADLTVQTPAVTGLIALAVLALGVWGWRREPRRLSVGVALLGGSTLLVYALVALVVRLTDDDLHRTPAILLVVLGLVLLAFVVVLAVFLVANGVTMLRRESRSLANVLSLGLGVALLGYLAVCVSVAFMGSPRTAALVIFSIAPVVYVSFALTAFVLYSWLYGRYAARSPSRVAAVVVLGAGLLGDRVTPLLAGRLTRGQEELARVRAAGSDAVLVVSGGQGPEELVSEAAAMGAWLRERGTPPERVVQEDRSTTTRENLLFSVAALGGRGLSGGLAVVSSDYHAFRAATLMRSLGIDGYAVGARTARYYWPSAMIREFIAVLRDNIRLNLVALGLLTVPLVLFLLGLAIVAIAR